MVARAKERCLCSLIRGKLFISAIEKTAVPRKTMARPEIVFMRSIFMN
jgi:hypothetical protein